MTDLPWGSMLLAAGAFLAVFATGEGIHRRWGIAPELTRKLDHVAAGGVALALPVLFESPVPVLILAVSFVAFLAVTGLAGWMVSVHGIRRASVGAFVYPLAIAMAFVIAYGDPERYAIAILALAVSDAAGWIVGARSGRRAYAVWGQAKSLEGSAAIFAVTTVVATAVILVSGAPPIAACINGLFTGAVVALVEGALPLGLDNLGVPLAALAAVAVAGSVATASALLLVAAALFGLALAWPRRGEGASRTRGAPRTAVSDAK